MSRHDPNPDLVRLAVQAVIAGDRTRSESLLRSIDEQRLEDEKQEDKRRLRRSAAPDSLRDGQRTDGVVKLVPKGKRDLLPSELMGVFVRDGFVCRFEHCQRRTIIPPILRLLSTAHPKILRWNKNWRDSHNLYWLYTASGDHTVPWTDSRSSDTSTNVVTTCYWCNQLKSRRRNESLGWRLAPEPQEPYWDGLAPLLHDLVSALRPQLPNGDHAYFDRWTRAVGASQDGLSATSIGVTTQDLAARPSSKAESAGSAETTETVDAGSVVRGIRTGRTQVRNYVVEEVGASTLFAREFWFRDSDDVCVYSKHKVELETIVSVEAGRSPIEGRRLGDQPAGTYLPPKRR